MDHKCIICNNSSHIFLMHKFDVDFCACKNCQLEFMYPTPTQEQLNKIYGEHYFDTWKMGASEEQVAILKKATFTLRLDTLKNNLKQNASVLDCGCATGYFLDVAQNKGYKPYGIEISEYGATVCKKKFGESSVFQGEIENAHFDTLFDAVFMSDYIEHVIDPVGVLKKANSLTKINGCIVITTPKVNSWSKRLQGKNWSQYKAEHLHYFNTENITTLLNKCGYSNIVEYKAKKCLTLNYVFSHFKVYKHWLLTPIFNFLSAVIPAVIKNKLITIVVGDMLIVATKK